MEVVLRVLRGPLVLGHVRALAGELARVSVPVARRVLAERPDWVEVVHGQEFLGPPAPVAEAAQSVITRAPDADAVLTGDPGQSAAEPIEPELPAAKKGSRK